MFVRKAVLLSVCVLTACVERVIEPMTSDAEVSVEVETPDASVAMIPDAEKVDAGVVDAGVVSACAPVRLKTQCKSGGNSAIVRGVARFPSLTLDAGTKPPALAVFMRHELAMNALEETIGGRLHAHRYIKLTEEQAKKGEASFEIDLCTFGTAMWSEENGDFNVVVMLDEKGVHQFSMTEEYPFQTPQKGEWVKMVQKVNVSCHAESACLEMTLDCNQGTSCTTFTPLQSVKCRTPSCQSDHAICSP